MREKTIEQYLVSEVEKLDGIAYKFKSPQRRSVPDRLCAFPDGVLAFVEVKATGEEPTEAQYREMNRLSERGHWVLWVQSHYEVTRFINKIKQMIGGDYV